MGKDAASVLGSRAEEKKIRNTISTRKAHGIEAEDDSAVWLFDAVAWENVQNPCWRKTALCMVAFRLLPEDRTDATFVKVGLRWLQYLSLIADLSAACVAIVTFNGVTYCCGDPILNFGSIDWPWEHLIRILTYVYLVLILAEIYPVVKKEFPFNIVNPIFGFVITVAMFFDDSKFEALLMWCIETFAVLCEYGMFCFKAYQRDWVAKEVNRLAKLTIPKKSHQRRLSNQSMGKSTHHKSQHRRMSNSSMLSVEEDDDQLKSRQDFFRLKLEQKFVKKQLWYLRIGCYLNLIMVFMILAAILIISRAGGLCIVGHKVPNLLETDQLSTCTACNDIDGLCEVCGEGVRMCYFPYS